MNTPVELHLRIQIKPGRRAAFHSFLREAIPYYEKPRGIRVRLLEDPDLSGGAIEIVEYASEAAYRRDQQRVEHDPEMKKYLQRWRKLLATEPHIEVYRPVSL